MSTATRTQSWAGDPPHADAARSRLLEAACHRIAADGLRGVSVAGVAEEAGVSRPTVYRYFHDREQLVTETLNLAAIGLRLKIRARIEALSDPGEMLVEALIIALVEIPDDPVLRALWDSTAADPAIVEQFTLPSGLAWAREALDPAVAAAGWSADEADEVMEVLLRMVLSLLISPAPQRSEDELRSFLNRRVLPGLISGVSDD